MTENSLEFTFHPLAALKENSKLTVTISTQNNKPDLYVCVNNWTFFDEIKGKKQNFETIFQLEKSRKSKWFEKFKKISQVDLEFKSRV